MATIVEMINPLTGLPEQVDKLDHTAQEIDDAVGRSLPGAAIDAAIQAKPNPNLLDNWYFGNPVNQRGNTEYTNIDSYSYGIDRWICRGIALSDTGITFTGSGSFIDQILDPSKKAALSGKAVTASILLDSGELIYGTLQYESSVSEQKIFATGNIQLVLLANGIIRLYSIGNYTAVAAKLELGDRQTLAHQDADGNWVLNEIPDYGEQLRRCQRYFVNFNPYKVDWFAMSPAVAANAYQAYSSVILPVAMRTQPSVSFGGKIVLSQAVDNIVTGILTSESTFTGNSIQLRYDVGADSLTANSLYRVQGYQDNTSYIHLSADL